MVLMKGPDHKINGKTGAEILFDYLKKKGLDCHCSGGWISDSASNEWYLYIASDIQPLYDEDSDW